MLWVEAAMRSEMKVRKLLLNSHDSKIWDLVLKITESGGSKVTKKGLLTLCLRLNLLTYLNVGTHYNNPVDNRYCDEEATILARHLPQLERLEIWRCLLGWEALSVLSNNLLRLEDLKCHINPRIRNGCSAIGRMRNLQILNIGSCWLT